MPNKKQVAQARKNKAMKPESMDIEPDEPFNDLWTPKLAITDDNFIELPDDPEPDDDEIIGDDSGPYRTDEEYLQNVQ